MDYVSVFKKRVPGEEECCVDCFLSLVCLTNSQTISPHIFYCKHCWELNVSIYEEIGRWRTHKLPAVCPLVSASTDGVLSGTNCDPCNIALRKRRTKMPESGMLGITNMFEFEK